MRLNLVWAGFLFLLTTQVYAHEWYPRECCHDVHCFEIPFSDIELKDDGYLIKPTGEFIPFTAPIFPHKEPELGGFSSPDGHFHGCTFSGILNGHLRSGAGVRGTEWYRGKCFWAPMMGM